MVRREASTDPRAVRTHHRAGECDDRAVGGTTGEGEPAARALIDSSVQGEITNYLPDILAEVIEPELHRVLGAAAQS